MPKIAIVTSIAYGGNNQSCFERGVQVGYAAALPQIVPFQADGNYEGIQGKVRDAINDHPAPDLVVTAGGIVAANAAAAVLNTVNSTAYIYLAGIVQAAPGPTNKGGAVLNTPAQNPDRCHKLDYVLNGDYTNVYLVINNNNPMETDPINGEAAQWRATINNHVRAFFTGGPNPTPPADPVQAITGEVNAFAPSAPSGLVISSDPFFRLYVTTLVRAFRTHHTFAGVPICYPFKDYTDHDNSGHGHHLDKPQLSLPLADAAFTDTGYYQLGLKAGTYLRTLVDQHVIGWDRVSRTWH
jgi:hypothetical protein